MLGARPEAGFLKTESAFDNLSCYGSAGGLRCGGRGRAQGASHAHRDPIICRLCPTPWNKGRLIGQKRPLRRRKVWAIRVRLQLEKRKRDLALFNLAIDSKLRGCDLVQLRVSDV